MRELAYHSSPKRLRQILSNYYLCLCLSHSKIYQNKNVIEMISGTIAYTLMCIGSDLIDLYCNKDAFFIFALLEVILDLMPHTYVS